MRNIIIYIGSMRFPDKTAGAHRAFSLSKSFRDLGYRVVLIGLDDKQQKNDGVLSTNRLYQGIMLP